MYYTNEKIPAEQKNREKATMKKQNLIQMAGTKMALANCVSKGMVNVKSARQNKRLGWKADVHLKK